MAGKKNPIQKKRQAVAKAKAEELMSLLNKQD